MKSGNSIIRAAMWVLMGAILAYFGVYAAHIVFDSFTTEALYSYAAEEMAQTSGYIVRQEQVVAGGSELTAVVVAEGERVAVGDTLALVYADQEALQRHREIEALEARLRSLQYIFSHSVDGADSEALNNGIVDSITRLRKTTADGDLSQLPQLSDQLKRLMFRRDYTYSGSTSLNREMTDLDERIQKLAEQNRPSTSTITTECSGTFSGMVDGYEEVLTPEAVQVLTPERLEELVRSRADVQEKVDRGEYLGKLVTGNSWYFVAALDKESADRLRLGGRVTTRLGGMDRTLEMRVESISTPDEEGRVCILLSSDRFMEEATLLRDQTADLIFNTVTGFYVAKSAIHVDNKTGEVGVYRVFGSRLRWIPVEILWEDEDYYLIRQATQYDEKGEEVPLTTLQEASRLRAGAQIAVKGRNLYDGKVIE